MIVVPALHPAHDVIVRVDDLEPGVVLRVGMEAMLTGVGGKAVNVALAIAAMDVPVRLVVCGDETLLDGIRALAPGHPPLVLVPRPHTLAILAETQRREQRHMPAPVRAGIPQPRGGGQQEERA